MRIAVCDDVSEYREELTRCIRSWSKKRRVPVQVAEFESGEEILFALESEGDFGVVFMEARLGGMNGMETAARLRKHNSLVSIVFVSRYERYLKEMYAVYPSQYIAKPVSDQKVTQVMDKVRTEYEQEEIFSFRHNRVFSNLSLKKVLYFASDRRRVRIVMEGGEERIFYEKLNAVEKRIREMNSHFLRIHQSFLVNERHISRFFSDQVQMQNGERLSISREKRSMVRKYCMNAL